MGSQITGGGVVYGPAFSPFGPELTTKVIIKDIPSTRTEYEVGDVVQLDAFGAAHGTSYLPGDPNGVFAFAVAPNLAGSKIGPLAVIVDAPSGGAVGAVVTICLRGLVRANVGSRNTVPGAQAYGDPLFVPADRHFLSEDGAQIGADVLAVAKRLDEAYTASATDAFELATVYFDGLLGVGAVAV